MHAKNNESKPASSTADRELINTRVFDAPQKLVYEAWTNPKHIAKWWGPNGFTNTIHEMAVKPGGVFRFIMHGPDGTDFPSKIVYREVVPPSRLVFDYSDEVENAGPPFLVTVTFEDLGGKPPKTKMTMIMLCATAEMCAEIKKSGAIEGGKQTMDRLVEYLKTM